MALPVALALLAAAGQLIPLTPIIDQLPTPVGVAPPVGPVTVAVKVKEPPSATVGLLVVTATDGTDLISERLKVLLAPPAL